MNELILELAKQAGLKFSSETAMSPVELKFAEMIVRECIAQAVKEEERYDSLDEENCDYCSMAMANFQEILKQHFGVQHGT